MSLKKKKVEQSTLTLIGVEVDKDELNKKLFSGFDVDYTPKNKNTSDSEEQAINKLIGDADFYDEMMDAFNKKGETHA
jgi:hypothetical protein